MDSSENITVLISGTPEKVFVFPADSLGVGEYLIQHEVLPLLTFRLINWTVSSFYVNVTIKSTESSNGDVWEDSTEVEVKSCTMPQVDTRPPVINDCPQPVTFTVPSNSPSRIVSWTEPSAVDDSGVSMLVTQSHFPGQTFFIGTAQVEYIFSDASGNTATCSFSIVIVDETVVTPPVDTSSPIINRCPESVTYNVTSNSPFQTVFWVEPSAVDDSGVTMLISQSRFPGAVFFVGITQIEYIFSDQAGNTASCIFSVNIVEEVVVTPPVDTTPPVVTGCPDTVSYSVSSDSPVRTVSWIEPNSVDDSGVSMLVAQSHFPGYVFAVGITQVAYLFSDPSGNTATCSFFVIIDEEADVVPPVVLYCPGPIRRTLAEGSTSLSVNWIEPSATDNSGIAPTIYMTHSSGGDFTIGSTQVVYTFTDQAGNSATCRFTVEIARISGGDNTPPEILNCPSGYSIVVPPGINQIHMWWVEPTASDPSGPVIIRQTHRPLDIFRTGITTVVYTFTDSFGNMATCSFDINILGDSPDDVPPVITGCPDDIRITTLPGDNTVTVRWNEPTSRDDSGVVPSLGRSHAPGSSFSIGSTTVTYTFTDGAGNRATCLFDVIVTDGLQVDTTPPVILFCPDDITHLIPLGTQGTTASWSEPQVIDDSGMAPTVRASYQSGDFFEVGTTRVVYTFTDAFQNVNECVFTVNIIESPCMPNPCEFGGVCATGASTAQSSFTCTCPSGLTGDTCNSCDSNPCLNGGICTASNSGYTCTCANGFSGVQCQNDACDPSPCVNSGTCLRVFGTPGYQCMCIGGFTGSRCEQVVSGCSSSPCMNEGTCYTGDRGSYICQCTQGFTGSHCETAIDITPDHPCSDMPCSDTSICLFDDTRHACLPNVLFENYCPCLNDGTCMEDTEGLGIYCSCPNGYHGIICEQDISPDIEGCPQNITVDLGLGPNRRVSWQEPVGIDSQGRTIIATRTNTSGSTFPIGETIVEYVFTDDSGNTANCIFLITVADTTSPEVNNCPANLVQTLTSGSSTVQVIWTPPTSRDNSNLPVDITQSHDSGSSFAVGVTTVTYTFTDVADNEAVCEFNVTVTESQDITPDHPCSDMPCSDTSICLFDDTRHACLPNVLFANHCPCLNEGTCMEDTEGLGIYCSCPGGYYGIICEQDGGVDSTP
ncbi:hyalin-like isoform X3 [Amphiura filiformis]|uniref:hyalin-like isoform X3 n=1 Tax=Amphiura filiformis TaxID=82378 RepID=UPI003B212DD6